MKKPTEIPEQSERGGRTLSDADDADVILGRYVDELAERAGFSAESAETIALRRLVDAVRKIEPTLSEMLLDANGDVGATAQEGGDVRAAMDWCRALSAVIDCTNNAAAVLSGDAFALDDVAKHADWRRLPRSLRGGDDV